MKTIFAPHPIPHDASCVFLAGSIDLGQARNWQKEVMSALANTDWTILNPRRPDWDNSWKQSMKDARFVEQVNWELDGLEAADIILMYLDPGTKAPVSMLELGLFARSEKMMVCCPEGFWRKGNVDIIYQRFNIPVYESFEELLKEIRQKSVKNST